MRGDLFEAVGVDVGRVACWQDDGPAPPPPPPPLPPPLPPPPPPPPLQASSATNSVDIAASQRGQPEGAIYKDVVIIGNGPSAICLSYILAGNWPFYGDAVHPIDFLHHRLDANRSESLLKQDLRCLCEGLEGRSNNPVSVLFDTLNHADADLGVDSPSFLRWIRQPSGHDVDHVVLGRGLPGGSWQSMDQSALTLSMSNWMELPGFGYKDFEQERLRSKSLTGERKQSRALFADVALYYREYVKVQQLDKYFRNHTVVTSARRVDGRGHLWEVCGRTTPNRKSFRYVTPRVVLATGISDISKRLFVPGEDLPFVLHSSSQLEHEIAERGLGPHSDPLMVVGAGLTAADAIITARYFGVPVAHVFRRSLDDPSLIFRNLHENTYPEYHKVYWMMRSGGNGYRGYRSYARHQILELLPGNKVRLEGPNVSLVLKVSHVLVLIGSRPNLAFLGSDVLSRLTPERSHPTESKQTTLVVDAFTHESVSERGLFAVGPLVGDNFVRFVQGGALAVANHLERLRMGETLARDDGCLEVGCEDVDRTRATSARSDDGEEDDAFDGLRSSEDLASTTTTVAEGKKLRRWRFKVQGKQRQQRKRRFSHPVCDL